LANTLGNHDRPRTLQAHSDGVNDQALARVSLALLLTLRGTPFLYYGEEIGMDNLYLEDPVLIRDRVSFWVYKAGLERGEPPQAALDLAVRYGRDQCRTPMQWSEAPNGGFCPEDVQPWLPVHPNHAQGVNVADQQDDLESLLHYYRRLLKLRKVTPALQVGDYQVLHEDTEDYLAYLRHSPAHKQTCLVGLNFSFDFPLMEFREIAPMVRCLFSTHRIEGEIFACDGIRLSPFEVFIGEIIEEF
jgi:alpha-glucosidase